MNKQKDRLVELLSEDIDMNLAYYVADNLLTNGVIVPPCRVGDVVYWYNLGGKLTEGTVVKNAFIAKKIKDGYEYTVGYDDIGKTVFLTKEEAEAKLKEGVQG